MPEGPVDFDKLHADGIPLASIPAGEKVFLQDEPGGTMYLVRSGLIDILMFGRVLETVGEFGIIGELSLIDQAPRSAAALAATNAEVAILDRSAFLRTIKADPEFALYVLEVLSKRLRKLDELLAQK